MRKGLKPRMLLDQNGRMFAFATGADFTTEHECGSNEMQAALTVGGGMPAEEVAKHLKARMPGGLDKLFGKRPSVQDLLKDVPDLSAAKRIKRNLQMLKFEEREVDSETEAALIFSRREEFPFDNPELHFSCAPEGKGVAGAWDAHSFGFRVRGASNVAQLREFTNALKQGRGIFAGTFLKPCDGERLSGVIIAIEDMLPSDHFTEMKMAQEEYVSNVELYLRANVRELRQLSAQLKDRYITHIWPVWRDSNPGTDVVYAVNPGRNVDLPYYGPYEFDDLKAWLEAGAATSLRPRTVPATA